MAYYSTIKLVIETPRIDFKIIRLSEISLIKESMSMYVILFIYNSENSTNL